MQTKQLVKCFFRLLAHLIVLPFIIWHWLWVPFLGADRCLQGSSEALSLIPGVVGQYLRRAFLSWIIEECHPTSCIGFGTIFSKVTARIGKNAYIGPGCHLGMVHVQENALLAAGVHVTSGAKVHGIEDLSIPIREQPGQLVQVVIGSGAWIGSGAIIMADVGNDSIIGAGAVVTQPIPSQVIAAGVPARVIRSRLRQSVPNDAVA